MLRARTLIAAASLVLASAASAAGKPRAVCRAERVGARALVSVSLGDLVEEELLRLVRLGLEGSVTIDATLFRARRFWVDQRRAGEKRTARLTFARGEARFLLDAQPVADPRAIAVPAFVLRPDGDDLDETGHYVEIEARIEVVTAASLSEMARWMAGEEGRSRLSRGLVTMLAADLARGARARCVVR